MRLSFVLLMLLLPCISFAQPNPTFGTMHGDASATTALPAYATAARVMSAHFNDWLNVKDFGALGTANGYADGSMTSGSQVFNSASATFTPADVGKELAESASLTQLQYGTITAYVDAHDVDVSFTASAAISNAQYYYGFDDSAAIATAMAKESSLNAQGIKACVFIPAGSYYIIGTNLPTFTGHGGCIEGASVHKTYLLIDPQYNGDVLSWNNVSIPATGYGPQAGPPSADFYGPTLKNITINGFTAASNQQNAIMLYGEDQYVDMENIEVNYMHGYKLSMGHTTGTETHASIRESFFSNIRGSRDGTSTLPAMDITDVGTIDSTNQIFFVDYNDYSPQSTGVQICSQNANNGIGNLRFVGFRVEQPVAGDNLDIGCTGSVYNGQVSDITFSDAILNTPPTGYYALSTLNNGTAQTPLDITFDGNIGGDGGGGVLNLQAGQGMYFNIRDISSSTAGTFLTTGSGINGRITINANDGGASWTTSLNSATQDRVLTNVQEEFGNRTGEGLVSVGLGDQSTAAGFANLVNGQTSSTCSAANYDFVTGKNGYACGNSEAAIGVGTDPLAITGVSCFASAEIDSGAATGENCREHLYGKLAGTGTVILTTDNSNALSLQNSLSLASPHTGSAFMAEYCTGTIMAEDITADTVAAWPLTFFAQRSPGTLNMSLNNGSVGTAATGSNATLVSALTFAAPTANMTYTMGVFSVTSTSTDTIIFSANPDCNIMAGK